MTQLPHHVSRSIVIVVKDDARVDVLLTTLAEQIRTQDEVVVIDASEGRIDHVRQRHREVRWENFRQPPGVRLTIPHQRNTGLRLARGEIVVFVDADCEPDPGWLDALTEPISAGREDMCAGGVRSKGDASIHDRQWEEAATVDYLEEAPTQNLALRAGVADRVGDFDESLRFGSDVDFTWRARAAGYRIRSVPEAVVAHDWGTARQRVRRAFLYGEARARLYKRHPGQWRRLLGPDAHKVVYVGFVAGLPLMVKFRSYPLLLLLPILKNLRRQPIEVVGTNLITAIGSLRELLLLDMGRGRAGGGLRRRPLQRFARIGTPVKRRAR